MSWEEPEVDYFRGLNLNDLWVDEAYLNVTIEDGSDYDQVFLYSLSSNCYDCPFQYVAQVDPLYGTQVPFLTHYPWTFKLRSDGGEELISARPDKTDELEICRTKEVSMGQFGVYDFVLSGNDQCNFNEALEPVNANLSLLYAFLILTLLVLVYVAMAFCYNKGYFNGVTRRVKRTLKGFGFDVGDTPAEEQKDSLLNGGDVKPPPAKKRLRSLDTFRGFSMAILIFVNDGAGGYYFFEHATWNGLHVADLAFPWFMWIMGFCIPMSVRSSIKRGNSLTVMLYRVVNRTIKLFALGFFYGNISNLDFSEVRIMGVLQRFSLSYFAVATTCTLAMHYGQAIEAKSNGWLNLIADVVTYWPRWLVVSGFLLLHTCITFLLPVPGCPTGYLGPAGLADDAKYPDHCIGGAAGHIDRQVLTEDHMYAAHEVNDYYESGKYDPEGLLGSLTGAFQVFLGCQAGYTVLTYSGHWNRLIRFVIWGILTGSIALLLCEASLNDGWVPINKNLWSISYALATTSLAFFLLSIMYAIIDIFEWWKGAPFFYAGMNSIVIYLGSGVARSMFPFNYISSDMDTHWELLVETLWGCSLWFAVAYEMYRRDVFIVL